MRVEVSMGVAYSSSPSTAFPIQYFKIVPKILRYNRIQPAGWIMCCSTDDVFFTLLASSISTKAKKWKWRKRRAVTGFRPPPGGPIAATKFTSMMVRKSPMFFLSYQPNENRELFFWRKTAVKDFPLKSIHCRMSSMGGCAPYTSKAGILKSSMKKICRLSTGGPNTPLRLRSSFESIKSCNSFQQF